MGGQYFGLLAIFLFVANVYSIRWLPDSSRRCSQDTKQKAMYGIMTFQPPLSVYNTFKRLEVTLQWDKLDFNPISNPRKHGGSYISYTMNVKNGPGGYFGAQLWNNRGAFILSIWDGDRFNGAGHSKTVKPSSKLAWPITTDSCKRNCQDCGLAELKKLAKNGLTTGTKCMIDYPIKVGNSYKLVLEQTQERRTINTADYEGMGKAHATIGETDRKVEGYVWTVSVKDLALNTKEMVGAVLFEGNGDGMYRLGTFDEMIGCVKCNAIHHKDTRYNLKLDSSRYPIKMRGSTRTDESTCKMQKITGSKHERSITFESGPFTQNPFDKEVTGVNIW